MCAMATCKSAANLVLLTTLALPLFGQSSISIIYQNRGRYNEGVRTEPSTGPGGLELIAALVDYEEPSATLPPEFTAQFYLPTQDRVDLTIREIKPVYFYWLDKVNPDPPWQPGTQNRFEWPTATVIRSLNWESEPLTLNKLGATVRVGRVNPGEAGITSVQLTDNKSNGGEGGIRTLGTGVSPYNGLAMHRRVLNRYENLLLYSSFQRVTRRSI
jgi:hypothetical protein